MTPRCSARVILHIMVLLPIWGKTRKGQFGSRMELKASSWTFEKPIRQPTTNAGPGSLQIVLHRLTNCMYNSYNNCVVEKDSHCLHITDEEMKASFKMKRLAQSEGWLPKWKAQMWAWGWRCALGSVLTWDCMRPPRAREERAAKDWEPLEVCLPTSPLTERPLVSDLSQ